MTASPLETVAAWSQRTAAAIDCVPGPTADAVTRVYLLMRGLDEIEDHPTLPAARKIELLESLDRALRLSVDHVEAALSTVEGLEEVTMRLPEWCALGPGEIAPRMDICFATLAHRMAYWVRREWTMTSFDDLLVYIGDVATSPLLLLDDVLSWGLGIRIDRRLTVAASVGVQLGNIVHGLDRDGDRGVDFRPIGWSDDDLRAQARAHRPAIDVCMEHFEPGPGRRFMVALVGDRY